MALPKKPLISYDAYMAAEGTFFGLAIIFAVSRISIRLYKFRRIYADDYFLFLAMAALIGSNGFYFVAVPELYFFSTASITLAITPNIIQTATDSATYSIAAQVLSWTTIFAVKLSFIFYFRTLVQRLPWLMMWWRIVLAVCVPVAIVSICGTFIVCPYVGYSILAHCLSTPDFVHRERIVLIYSVVSDIVTDVLIVSIPISLLRQTHLKVRQKASIGVLLCLSMVMIAIAMIRGISAGVYGTHDQIWAAFWVQLEASVSVTMVSTMVFKTLFIAGKSSTPNKHSLLSRDRLWRARRTPQLPSIETGATMTGMRTVIRENGSTKLGSLGKESSPLTGSFDVASNGDSTLAESFV